MSLRLLAAALLLVSALAGCAEESTTTTTDGDGAVREYFAGPALWPDPQNAPHPKWNWATLSNPPAGDAPYWWQPINATPLPDHISGMQHVVNVGGNVTQGSGIALFGRIAVVPDDSEFVHFVDISEPARPVVLGNAESGGRGAAVIAYPDGRLVTALATTPGFDIVEFTDPNHPVKLSEVSPTQGGHKLGVVPGTPILYNAASVGGEPGNPLFGPGPCNTDISRCTGVTEIYNLTDPSNPTHVQDFANGVSCHHIFFWNNVTENRFRAICAGIQYTQLWDTADPEHPKVIVSIPVHAGQQGTPSQMASIAAFSHSAGINIAGDVLYVGDESGGGLVPPGCGLSAALPTDGSSAGTPVGATWFYDISNELDPTVLGYFEPPLQTTTYTDAQGNVHSTSCTTHHGRLVPDLEGRDLLAMSYYGDGVILIDFTGVGPGVVPKMVDQFQDSSNTWETWYNGGYLFTGDLARGMDVLKLR